MLARLLQHADAPAEKALRNHAHILFLLPKAKQLSDGWPERDALAALLKRRHMKVSELGKTPLAGSLGNGALAAWGMLDPGKSQFESQTAVRNALQLLLAENPREVAIVVPGDATNRKYAAEVAVYCAWINGARLPERKKKAEHRPLRTIHVYGHRDPNGYPALRARAEGLLLCRELTMLPPNELTPASYRSRIRQLARQHGWEHEE